MQWLQSMALLMPKLIFILLLFFSSSVFASASYNPDYCATGSGSGTWTFYSSPTSKTCDGHGPGNCLYHSLKYYGGNYYYFACSVSDGQTWPNVDTDGDGVLNECDSSPYDPSITTDTCTAPVDSDNDGIPDSEDACPNDATNTCNDPPPVDSDNDGIPDSEDACPNDATNTCTDPVDTDNDGTPDSQDVCPDDPFDECVANDTDQDGILNADDVCPTDPDNNCVNCDIYLPTGDNFIDVFSDVSDTLATSALVTSVSALFTVSGSGSCPVWSFQFLEANFVIDFQCSTAFRAMLVFAGYVLMFGATLVSIKTSFT